MYFNNKAGHPPKYQIKRYFSEHLGETILPSIRLASRDIIDPICVNLYIHGLSVISADSRDT